MVDPPAPPLLRLHHGAAVAVGADGGCARGFVRHRLVTDGHAQPLLARLVLRLEVLATLVLLVATPFLQLVAWSTLLWCMVCAVAGGAIARASGARDAVTWRIFMMFTPVTGAVRLADSCRHKAVASGGCHGRHRPCGPW